MGKSVLLLVFLISALALVLLIRQDLQTRQRIAELSMVVDSARQPTQLDAASATLTDARLVEFNAALFLGDLAEQYAMPETAQAFYRSAARLGGLSRFTDSAATLDEHWILQQVRLSFAVQLDFTPAKVSLADRYSDWRVAAPQVHKLRQDAFLDGELAVAEIEPPLKEASV